MLRPSTRKTPDIVLVASLAVLAKAEADMRQLAKSRLAGRSDRIGRGRDDL